ncbi:MAG TPA: hypothetical protein H9816_04720 [Candidatus Tidjanibacter faecipullorum]|uniref:Peptidase S24/S26A/S26B/S26C domain-containing protein n=1 Tax=Candidatus Tidjanibacter faecipullorum TaxID=2838766 RepID=A0A9D2ILD6_9BACT|nr:hypothetical protein [Candidatus Tidjanibacter faecipullorum]
MQKIIDRIAHLIDKKGISIRSFEAAIGASNGLINRAAKKRTDINAEWLSKIISAFPDVNPAWLLTGEGEMFRLSLESSEEKSQTKCAENATLSKGGMQGGTKGGFPKLQKMPPNAAEEKSQTKCAENTINLYDGDVDGVNDGKRNMQETPSINVSPKTIPSGRKYPEPHREAAMAGDARRHYVTMVEVPVVDVEAAAGGGSANSDYFEDAETLHFPSSVLSPTSSMRLCISVKGESMEPTLFDGTRIVVRRLDRSEWARIRSGNVYVVTDREGSTYVKRVRNNLQLFGMLTLVSDNPDQRKYKTFQLQEEEIFNVWEVELVISDTIPPSERERIDDLRDEMMELKAWLQTMMTREK